jgi:hypothetical protein
VLYSAVGSFFAPMLVMIFLNWRIYKTANKTIKAIRQAEIDHGRAVAFTPRAKLSIWTNVVLAGHCALHGSIETH